MTNSPSNARFSWQKSRWTPLQTPFNFSFWRNAGSDWISLTDAGREFHGRDAATGNARSPRVDRRVSGKTSVDVAADRRRRREATSAVRWSISARYGGAVPCRQRCVRTHSQKWILSGTFSQCSSRRSGVVCSDLLTEKTSRAAAFSGSTMCQIWWKSNINIYISIYQLNQYIK